MPGMEGDVQAGAVVAGEVGVCAQGVLGEGGGHFIEVPDVFGMEELVFALLMLVVVHGPVPGEFLREDGGERLHVSAVVVGQGAGGGHGLLEHGAGVIGSVRRR